jgi:hypothetical protein
MSSQLMGFLVFVAGLVMLIVAVLGMLVPMGMSNVERIVLFAGGVVTCLIGYFMATASKS